MTTKNVGFIGLGNIGKPIAINLAESDFHTTVFDINAEACQELADKGAHIAHSPAALADSCTHIGICVRNDADCYDVILGDNGIIESAQPGTVIAIHSTVRLETITDLAKKASAHKVTVIDAPISGGAHGAAEKNLCFMVGADSDTYAQVCDVFRTSGENLIHAGPLTSGLKVKLCNNLMTYLEFLAVHEGMKLAQACDLDTDVLKQVSESNGVLTRSMQMLFDSKKGFDAETFADIMTGFKAVAIKDLSIALELADSLDIALPGTGLCRESVKQVFGAK